MKHETIYAPVAGQLRRSMLLTSLAQVMKIAIWLLMVAVIYVLGNEVEGNHYWLVGALLVLTVVYYTLKIRAHDQSHYAAFRLEEILRQRLAKKISQLPIGYVRQVGTGALAKVMLDDIHALHSYIADAPPLKAEAYVTPVLVFMVLFYLDWRMALAVFGFSVLVFVTLKLLMRKGRAYRRLYSQALAQVNGAIIEYVQGMATVRTFDAGESSYSRYQDALENYDSVMQRWLSKIGITMRLARTLFTPMPMQIFLLAVGTYLSFHYQLSFTTFFTFLLLAAGIVETMHPYMGLHQLLEKSRASIERIFELEAQAALDEPAQPKVPANHQISYENVSFRYHADGPDVLREVNLTIPEHSFTAIVGSSGSGKTTLMNLLPRFWDVSAGCISIGGVDVREMTQDDLMARCSFVFQDNFLFSCTIADNIRYGLDADDAAVVAAAKRAEIHDFIMTLPEQYHTKVGERGQLLSGGQKQRLTIARAFLQDRPILVLDEPTAFSDAQNEALLMKAFNQLMQDKTVIMIAHRLSTIVHADQIVYLQDGQVIAQGTHAGLLADSPAYQKLWSDYQQSQSWSLTV
ncbi:MAG: ABC transporter ATP-binding protein [Neisseriaceae bacterium]|nr:ABC transporter ATP-binding protein [Neisseriaceae bacterium]